MKDKRSIPLCRRTILKQGFLLAASTVALNACHGPKSEETASGLVAVPIEGGVKRPWLGPEFWANGLQDWQLHDGMVQCIARGSWKHMRTVALLTRPLIDKPASAVMRARFHRLTAPELPGFTGFLIGIGNGMLDYRAAALAQHGSGTGGGLIACLDHEGYIQFRDHTDEQNPVDFERIKGQKHTRIDRTLDTVDLELHLQPQSDGTFTALLIASDITGTQLGVASLKGLNASSVTGGISLLCSPGNADGARWGITDIATGGDKIPVLADRALGPVMGTLHSLSKSVLKMTAQFMPLGQGDPTHAQLQYKYPNDDIWQEGPTVEISNAFVAPFRVEDWDASRDWHFRIVYPNHPESLWEGTIRREPAHKKALSIGLFSCVLAAGWPLDGKSISKHHPLEREIGRYTPDNIYFPYQDIIGGASDKNLDMLVFCGDQYYEFNPVRPGYNDPDLHLDTLYRWYLWYWSFRDLCRDLPTIILTDDHDILQGNVWGQGGRDAPDKKEMRGGYVHGADLVKTVHHFQCDHNPDPFDPTPIENDIPVYYGNFVYGGVSFALIEDRKFKTGPRQPEDFDFQKHGTILGERQEKFLEEWAALDKGLPKIVLSQTPWACVQTDADGSPKHSADSNGYLRRARNRAIRRVKRARAIMLSGDQHLATLIRHGAEEFTDGPVQFSGPAGATLFQRWFEPSHELPNARDGIPHTGDFRDAYKNRLRMIAVANPAISQQEFQNGMLHGQSLKDSQLKSEGYGVVRVDKQAEEFIFECWPGKNNEKIIEGQQYQGWPYRLKFSDV